MDARTSSRVFFSEEYQDALYRLNEYSQIEVLFYLHEMNRYFKTRTHPTDNPEHPKMRAFATRTPNRPSKIALTLADCRASMETCYRLRALTRLTARSSLIRHLNQVRIL